MSYLVALGTAVPAHAYAQSTLAEFMINAHGMTDVRRQRRMRILYQKTHIAQRHSVLPDFNGSEVPHALFHATEAPPLVEQRMGLFGERALPLAEQAVARCLEHFEQAQQQAADLAATTHLITVSCTGLAAPGLEIALAEALGLPADTTRLAVNFMGCYAAFHALKLAHAICRSEARAQVLVVCVELCTLHFQPNEDKDNLLANALFADGAAAALVQSADRADAARLPQRLAIRGFHNLLASQGKHDMAWHISATGFLMRLSSYIPDLVKEGIPPLLDKIFCRLNTRHDRISHWAIHPGGRRILEACQQVLQLPPHQLEAGYHVLKHYGNMSSPTILFVMQRVWQHQINWAKPEQLFAAGFGPGLTLEAALFEVQPPQPEPSPI